MRVLFIGSPDWPDPQKVRDVMAAGWWRRPGEPVTFVVGDYPTGVEKVVRDTAYKLGGELEVHTAHWMTRGAVARPERDLRMVDTGPDLVFAFVYNEHPEQPPATLSCLRFAREAGIAVGAVHRIDDQPVTDQPSFAGMEA